MTSESLDPPSSSCLAQEIERVLGARTYYDVLQVDPSECLPRSLLHLSFRQAPQCVDHRTAQDATTTTTEEDERRTAVRDVQEEEAEAEEEARRVRRVVATAYRQLALRLHPDRHSALPSHSFASGDHHHQEATDTDGAGGGGGGGVQQWKSQVVAAFAKVQEAYETLQDPLRRAAYDASLRCGAGSSSAALHSPFDEVTLQKAWIVLQQLFFSSPPPTVPAAPPSYSAPAEGAVGPPPEALRTFVFQSSASPTAAVPTAAPKMMGMQQQQTCRTSGCQEVVSILGATCHRCRNQPLASVSARCSEPGCLRLLTEADRLLQQQDHPSSNRAIMRAMCSHCRKKPVKCAKFGCLVKVPPDEDGGGGYCSKHRSGAV